MGKRQKVDVIKRAYDAESLSCTRFVERLSDQISEILASNGIALAVPIERRVKSWPSVVQKIEASGLKDLAQVGDLVGIRLILLFRRDVERVLDLLRNQLEVMSAEDTSDRLGVENFGYQSIHMQVRLPPAWLKVPMFSGFGHLVCEIQVRSAAQHIWAAASHVLQYKREQSVPKPVLRSINRVAALLETVDLEFERALNERDAYVQNAVAPTISGSTIINVDLLRELLDSSLPANNKAADEPYDELLHDLNDIGIDAFGSLKDLIENGLPAVLADEKEIVALARDSEPDTLDGTYTATFGQTEKGIQRLFRVDKERLDRSVFWTHAGLVREMLRKAGYKLPRDGKVQ
jgi:ppGpp synthetase/RelA/SpoT-type nucleotidyltranferase